MQIIDNINHIVKNDLQENIRAGSKLSIAAACFSIYAYQELKKQLEGIDELRFIFTSPTFVTEKASKAQREFYIPRISRERSLYGTEFRENPTEYRVSSLRAQLRGIIASECTDEVFKVGLANMRYRPTGGNKQLKYLFSVLTEHISWLEQGASGHPKPEKSNIINYDTITIEHISPQSPSGTSIFTGDDIHKLKNLTLLTPPENDLAANKDYAPKKPIYVNSTYKLNTFFESIDTWNVRASEQWETHLIDMACKIFVV